MDAFISKFLPCIYLSLIKKDEKIVILPLIPVLVKRHLTEKRLYEK